jgi:hypothetical protein
MSDVDVARERAQSTNGEAAAAETAAAQAESDRAAAQARAEADPSPANIRDLETATRVAAEAQDQAARKRSAATAATSALTDAQLAELNAQIAAASASLRQSANPNGINVLTGLHWDWNTVGRVSRIILNNAAIRVVGAEKKVSVGIMMTFIGGMKLEICLPFKIGTIAPAEHKRVVGANINNFGGLKMDTIGGAKSDHTYGSKLQHHAGPKISSGPGHTMKHPNKNLSRGLWQAAIGKSTLLTKTKQDKTGTDIMKSSKMLKEITTASHVMSSASMTASSVLDKLTTYKSTSVSHTLESSGSIELKASGTCKLEGGGSHVLLEAGTGTLKGGSTLVADGSGIHSGDKLKVC